MQHRTRLERDDRRVCARASLTVAALLVLRASPGLAAEPASARPADAAEPVQAWPPATEGNGGAPPSGETAAREPVGEPAYQRLVEVGPLVGVSARFGSRSGITYRPGLAVGGYLRPVLTDWLSVQLYGRFESIPVDVEEGSFDWDGASLPYAFSQSPLRLMSIGAAFEPNYSLTKRLRVYGSLGVAWVRFDADAPNAPGFDLEATRVGIEVNVLFGLGLAYDVVERYMTLHLSTSYGVAFDQRGSAFEPLQVIDGGTMYHLAPLPEFDGMADLLLGVSAAF